MERNGRRAPVGPTPTPAQQAEQIARAFRDHVAPHPEPLAIATAGQLGRRLVDMHSRAAAPAATTPRQLALMARRFPGGPWSGALNEEPMVARVGRAILMPEATFRALWAELGGVHAVAAACEVRFGATIPAVDVAARAHDLDLGGGA